MDQRISSDLADFWLACGLEANDLPRAIELYDLHWAMIQANQELVNLVGDVSQEDFYFKHVADSLAVLRAFPALLAGPVKLADVGCGAGLPGLALAVALPRLLLTAMESNHKKAAFLAVTIQELGLAGRAQALDIYSREASYKPEHRGQYQVVTARAVAAADRLIKDCRLLIAPGGSAILYKTPQAVQEELAVAERDAAKHKLSVELSEVIDLPAGAGKRQFMRLIRE